MCAHPLSFGLQHAIWVPQSRTADEASSLMSVASPAVERSTLGLHALEQYEPLIGAAVTARIFKKADRIRTQHVVHVSSTFYGGGVTEILTPADVDDECDRHRDRLAHDPGHARFLHLYEKAPQYPARRKRPAYRRREGNLRRGGI